MFTRHLSLFIIILISVNIIKAQDKGIKFYINILNITNSGEIEKAEQLIDEYEESCESDTLSFDYACVLASRAKILNTQSKNQEAIELRKRSIKIGENLGLQNRGMAILYSDLGVALYQNGDYNGLIYSQKASTIFRNLNEYQSLAQCYYTIHPALKDEIDVSACLYFAKLAKFYFEKSVNYSSIDSLSEDNKMFLSMYNGGIAQAYQFLNIDSAEYYYRKSNEIIEKSNSKYALYYKYMSFGGLQNLALRKKDYQKAYENGQKVMKYIKLMGFQNTKYAADIYVSKAVILNGLNMPDSAEYYANKAMEMYYNINPKHRWISACYATLADIEEKKGNYLKSLSYANNAMYSNAPYTPLSTDIYSLLPLDSAYYSVSNFAGSIDQKARLSYLIYKEKNDLEHLKKANDFYSYYFDFILDAYYKNSTSRNDISKQLENDLQTVLSNYLNVASELYQHTQNEGIIRKSYDYLSSLKAGLLNEQAYDKIENMDSAFVKLSDQLLQLKSEIQNYNFIINYENISEDSLIIIHDKLAQAYIESFLLKKEIEKKYHIKDSIPDLSSQIDLLNDNQSIVDYYYYDTLMYVYSISNKHIDLKKLQIEKDFKKDIQLFNRYLKTNSSDFNLHSKKMYSVLLSPVIDNIKSSQGLVFIPYKLLFNIPFEALIDDNNNYLVEKRSIAYNFNGNQVFIKLKEIKSEKQNNELNFIGYAPGFEGNNSYKNEVVRNIAIADTAFRNVPIINKLNRELTPLPFAQDEVKEISEIFKTKALSSEVVLGIKATETHLKNNYKNKKIIHIASHGYASVKYSELSGIFFYPGNDNGYLFLNELYPLDIDADLVVLSACQSGKGDISGMEGTISLPRGFAISGAKNVIASLWKVHDKRTKELMVAFYKHLIEKNLSYSEALRLAKIDCINRGFMPLDWTGFILFGI